MNNTNFNDARKTLGITLHTLQDFYSHSNWIELSNTEPCTALINQDENIPNPAGKNESTCEDKADGKSDIIRAEILQQKKLTSGYTRKSRPEGKCSHGGFRDFSCGINKDYNTSCHGSLHSRASEVAIKATVQLLEEILRRSDPLSFFRLVGLDERPVEGKLIALLFSAFRNRYPDASEDDNEVVEEPMD
ncbi:von Willebrand factor A domain-containing protein 7-like [Pseudorasbora parva]|uniref:von Willebrand factor A domain-containing protein 7-like n=1 Tax=Pseudorasbora parva TaxID=51549 RepID=UPI00351F7BE7